MQIVTTTVEQTTFRRPAANAARLDAARALIDELAGQPALLALPAGYLRVADGADEAGALELARPLVAAARRAGIGLVVGVDACGGGWAARRDVASLVERGALPMWAVGWAPGQRTAVAWRQRSMVSADARRCAAETVEAARTLTVHGCAVEVVISGEGFNERVRDAIAARAASLTAVVLVAHTAAGARHWQAQRHFATEVDLPALRSVHGLARATNAMGLGCPTAPTEDDLDVRAGPPWIAPSVYRFAS